jgi:hypothetical protein
MVEIEWRLPLVRFWVCSSLVQLVIIGWIT